MAVLSLPAVAEFVTSRPASAGPTRVVAIDGPSGSGKTTLARQLSDVLSCHTLHMDDLYPGWDGLDAAPSLLVEQVLRPLAEHRPASYRRWDWVAHRWAESHHVAADPVLIVEGVGSAALACDPYLSVIVWIEAPREERMRRGLERDGETYRPHWERWARQEQAMFGDDGTRERADLLVDGDPPIAHDSQTQLVLTR